MHTNYSILETADGSKTITLPDINENYHSKHGAILEAVHVYMQNGLHKIQKESKSINILEMGYGTGLNAYLSFLETELSPQKISYTSIEKFPLSLDTYAQLNHFDSIKDFYPYSQLFQSSTDYLKEKYNLMIYCEWDETSVISDFFELKKIQCDFFDITFPDKSFDLIYFDAFGPRVQPELWTEKIFTLMFKILKNNGILVTYCCKGDVKRNMVKAGFHCKKLPGPPGKREMLYGLKCENV